MLAERLAERPRLTLRLADTAVTRTLERLAAGQGWHIGPTDADGAHFLLLDAARPDAAARSENEGGREACRGVILLVAKADSAPSSNAAAIRIELPVTLVELSATIESLWQRAVSETPHRLGPSLRYVADSRRLEGRNGQSGLTGKEAELLEALLAESGGVSREALLQGVWRYAEGLETHTLETHVYRLRQKLEAAAPGEVGIAVEDGRYRLALTGG